MFKYNIDDFYYIPNNKIFIKGWFIGEEELKIFINKKEQIISRNIKRNDVFNSFKELTETDILGFELNIESDEDINEVSMGIYCNSREKHNIFRYNSEEMPKLKNTILYSIDSVEKEEENIAIKGWVFSKHYEEVSINVENVNDYEIKKYERLDVIRAHKDFSTTYKCGFEISCNNHNLANKIKLSFSDKSSSIKTVIDKKYMSKNSSNNILPYIYKNLTLNNIKKGFDYINKNGYKALVQKVRAKNMNNEVLYKQWLENNIPTEEQLKIQKKHKFNYEPLISVVVPTYNTPENFLREMIDSVIDQTYSNWELCIADGSNEEITIKVLKEYVESNKNIKVRYLESNEGISGNTNKALELAKGDYIGLFDHDDLLTPDALYEVVKAINKNECPDFIYTDEDKVDEKGVEFFDPHFKPDWSPDTLRSYNYITHFSVFKRNLLDKVGKFRSEFDGSQDYDLILRLTEVSNKIVHIPKILYHWRVHRNSVASGSGAKPYAYEAAKRAIASHLERIDLKGDVEDGYFVGAYKVNYEINNNPLISIIIPNKEHKQDLEKCINSILSKTTYNNYEIIVVENNSESKEIFDYYKKIEKANNITIIKWNSEFNYSAINNFGVEKSSGDYIILLNNDIEIISPTWIEEMLMIAQRNDVGIVGAKLYYPDDTIQHAGIILGIAGIAAHSHKYFFKADPGYFGRATIIQNLSAVTAACLMVKRKIYLEVNGLDEDFKVAYNDVDFCMKAREKGYLVVFTPYAEMYHYESKSRGAEDTDEKILRFENEVNRFKHKWGLFLEDPYYNKNLTLDKEDFSIKI